MKSKSHGCPYLQGKQKCVHIGNGKSCGYSTATDCEFYLEWEELMSENLKNNKVEEFNGGIKSNNGDTKENKTL